MSTVICPECGARLAEGVDRCDLCGAPVGSGEPADVPVRGDIPEPDAMSASEDGVYCNACGWRNPDGARYCSRCGAELQQVHEAASPGAKPVDARDVEEATRARPAEDSPDEPGGTQSMGLQVGLLVGLAVLVVVALFMITIISKQRVETEAEAAVQAPADVRSGAVIDEYESIPIGDQFAPVVDSLRDVIAEREGDAAHTARRELVDLMIDIGRVDRAAIEQQRLARQTDEVDDWRRAGNLLFDWMESVNSERKTDVALLTIDAYRNVLEADPNDLDARADLGWAYQYDPQNPMEAIRNTNLVLEQDPDHLAANYNRGVFLLRINRARDAVAQFERVVELADSTSLYARQASAWIRTIEESTRP